MASKPDKLRGELINMLLADRSFARASGNASASVTATTRMVDLCMEKLAEETNQQPITSLTHEITYSVLCPICRERQDLAGPLTEAERLPPKRVTAWDDDPDAPARAEPTLQSATPPPELPEGESLADRREQEKNHRPVRRA
jgi:hypothetical protein